MYMLWRVAMELGDISNRSLDDRTRPPNGRLSAPESSELKFGLGRDYQHRERLRNDEDNSDTPAHFRRILSMAFPLASSSTSLSRYRICCMSLSSISSTR